jgi:pimeloyl-ACP methyl ester carboxylesterase
MSTLVREELVTIMGEYKLAGTLTVPANTEEEKYPAVLIIPGTGNSDRDGNKGGLDMNLYKDIADFLTENGFVTLRYDKRGSHQSEGDKFKRGLWDLVNDGAVCLRFLKEHPYVDTSRIIILGHSEGTIIGPAVHAKEPAFGLILLSGGAMSLRDVTTWQRENALHVLGELKGFKGWLIRKLRAVEKARAKNVAFDEKLMNSNDDVLRVAGKKLPAKWMREHFRYDVSADLEHVTCPTLVVTGSKDVQAPIESVYKVAELVKGDVETHIIENMTHILKSWDGEIDSLNPLKVYRQQLKQPLDAELLKVMTNWFHTHFKG